MARQRKYPPKDVLERVTALAEDGTSLKGIAKMLNTSYDTFSRWMKEKPELRSAFEKAREVEHKNIFNSLYKKAMDGNVVAAIFLLKARHGYREGDQPDNANKVSINFTLPGAVPMDQYRARIIEANPQAVKALANEPKALDHGD